MTMNLFRIYDAPCGTLLCTVACCSDSPDAALEMARVAEYALPGSVEGNGEVA